MAREIKIEFRIPSFREILDFIKKVLSKILAFTKNLVLQCWTIAFIFLSKIFKNILSDFKYKKWRGLITLAVSVAAYFLWGLSSAILWLLFLAFLVYGWENRIIAACALICLVGCPFLLASKAEALTEQVTVYAYFFLVMTVILQIIDYRFGEYLRGKNLW